MPPWNLNSRMMIVTSGMAIFHQVMTLLTRANSRMARKFTATKTAIRTMVSTKPMPVTFPVSEL